MLKIGTHVFINRIIERERAHSTGNELDLIGQYGTVTDYPYNGYYTIEVVDDVTGEVLTGYFYHRELDDLGPDGSTYCIGDMVRICEMSQEDKDQYPVGWHRHMDKFIGQTLRITEHWTQYDSYKLEGNTWIWHANNLVPETEFVGY